jgi:hypothetical protein
VIMTKAPQEAKPPAPIELALLASVFVVAACGLLYELAAGAIASYVLGDSVLQFSTIIGTYLFAMGVGSWLSRYIDRQLPAQFLRIELLVGLVPCVCAARFSGVAVWLGDGDWHLGGLRNSHRHADFEAQCAAQRSGVAGADL